MATITASPIHSPSASSPALVGRGKSPALPPLLTNPPMKRTNSNRPTSFAQRRISSYSSTSRSNAAQSRPLSQVFPAFHSSLPYTLVRDFAYPSTHPLHYGPQAEPSGIATPASETRRLSDPSMASWEDSRSSWSATPNWLSESSFSSGRDQLQARTFNDGGPPYSEDEDLQSPVVTTSKHRKKGHLPGERGRSPGAAGPHRGIILNTNGNQIEEYHPMDTDEMDGPGGEIETHTTTTRQNKPRHHRDSNFAKPLQRIASPYDHREPISENDQSDFDEEDDDTRYSKDYSFTIASPDEEMHGKAVALFDFVPEHENELALVEGQIILVSYRHGQGWLVAEDPQTKESGLVPEEFVRLVRHIEGGLHGLNSVSFEDDGSYQELVTPISATTNDPQSATTPTQNHEDPLSATTTRPSNGDRHPAVQSSFSTSSRDFSPFKKEERSTEKE